ncbi:unnamed protein product, partial [Urochloa humidicola]
LSSLSLSLSRALSSNPARRWAHHQQQQADFSDEWRDACSSAELARQACALAAAAMGERRESGPDTGQREEEGSSQAGSSTASAGSSSGNNGTRFGQYIDWIWFSLCYQMLARRCFRQLQD